MMVGVRSRLAALSSMNGRLSAAGSRANLSIARGRDLEDHISHPARHLRACAREIAYILVVQPSCEMTNFVVIDLITAEVGESLDDSIRSIARIVEYWGAAVAERYAPSSYLAYSAPTAGCVSRARRHLCRQAEAVTCGRA